MTDQPSGRPAGGAASGRAPDQTFRWLLAAAHGDPTGGRHPDRLSHGEADRFAARIWWQRMIGWARR